MNLIQRALLPLYKPIIKSALEVYTKSSREDDLISRYDNKSKPPTLDRSQLLNLINQEIWVYVCTDLIAKTISDLNIKIYKETQTKDGIKYDYIDNHPFLDLLNKPNEFDLIDELIYLWVINRELTGMGYLYLDGTPGKDLELFVLPSNLISLVKNDKGFPKEYLYKPTLNDKITYKLEQIKAIRFPDPNNQFGGLSPVTPAGISINTLNESRITNWRIFKNSGKLDGYFTTEGSLSPEGFQRLSEILKTKFWGSMNAHKTPLLEGGLEFKESARSPAELEYITGQKLLKEDVCSAFNVPVILVNSMEQASYNNLKEAKTYFYEYCIIPRTKPITSRLTSILRMYPNSENLFCEFDLSVVKALKDDLEMKSNVYVKFVTNGIPINQAIKHLDLPFDAIDGGDVALIPFSLTELGSVPEVPESEPVRAVKPVLKRMNKLTDELIKTKWTKFVSDSERISDKYIDALIGYFKEQEKEVISNLDKIKSLTLQQIKDNNYVMVAEYDGLKKAIDVDTIIFNESEEIARLRNKSGKYYKQAIVTQAENEIQLLGLSIVFDVDNPRVSKFLEKYGLSKAESVVGTAANELKKELSEGVKNGESIPDLKKRVVKYYDGYQRGDGYKLERIARTEVIGASNFGSLESYKQAGVEKKSWLASLDGRHRDTHRQAMIDYEKGIPMGDRFIVGADSMDAPGQGTLAEENINCRCALIPIVEE